jgi:effector-binding domain-containing protein
VIDPPKIVETKTQLTAVIRLTIPRAEIQKVMGPAISEVMSTIAAQGLAPAGPVFSYHLRMDPAIFDFEVGVPVLKPVTATKRVVPSRLPAATVATTTYRGPYEGLGSAWGDLAKWIAAEGYEPGPDLWECYAAGPESNPDPATWRTGINRPVTPARKTGRGR